MPGPTRTARCRCGEFTLTLEGDPFRVSSCACTRCQRRTGAFFGVTAYFRPDQLTANAGASVSFHPADGETTFHFCPRCGSTLWWRPDDAEDVIGVAGGSFIDPALPSPIRMVFCATRHPYVRVPEGVAEYPDAPPD
jgi:hypothetical protein